MSATTRILGEALTPYQKKIYNWPERAYYWALKSKKRFYEAEPCICKDPYYALLYAKRVIKGRWPEAEPYILVGPPVWALHYARYVIKGRWPEAEPYILVGPPIWALHYAWYVIKGRWPEAEPLIATDPGSAIDYQKFVIKGRWPEAEETIAKSNLKAYYLSIFPEVKDEWVSKGWIDWLDT